MKAPESSPPRRRESQRQEQFGVVLILTLGILFLIVGMFVIAFGGNLLRQNTTDRRTAAALAQAKEALIGFAANYRDTHPGTVFGYLPCPDVDGAATEGSAELICGATDVTVIGRLPWKTLGLPPLRDGSGECLWYAVSGNFKYNPKTSLMNWDTNGLIEIMAPDGSNFVAGGTGTTAKPTMRAAAVIIAPGAVLPGQDRSLSGAVPPVICGGNYTAANYLDTDAASGINNATAPSPTANALSRFIAAINSEHTAAGGDSFNDRMAFVTPRDIFANRAQLRSDFLPYVTDPHPMNTPTNVDPNYGMLRMLAECIVGYGQYNSTASDKRLPWAAPLTMNNYGNTANYSDVANQYSGRLPYFLNASVAALPANKLAPLAPANQNLSNGTICPNWGVRDEFWMSWKDQVFYAVSQAFAPNSTVATLSDPCTGGLECMKTDGGVKTAAVLIFPGTIQTGQSRNTNADYTSPDKSNPANYLEGTNLTSIQSNTPSPGTPRVFSNAAGNDTVMCILNNPTLGLYADPSCGSTTVCTINATALAAYRSGDLNLCRDGTSDKAIAPCKTLDNKIGTLNCSCAPSSKEFVGKECITKGFGASAPAKCPAAYNALLAC
jgi:hypothetical protein